MGRWSSRHAEFAIVDPVPRPETDQIGVPSDAIDAFGTAGPSRRRSSDAADRVIPMLGRFGQPNAPRNALAKTRVGHASPLDSALPSEWIDGLTMLETKAPPLSISVNRWQRIVDDADLLVRQWGVQAAALGWTSLQLFGAHPVKPVERHDLKGLAMLVYGNPIVAMNQAAANMSMPSGSILTYRRRPIDPVAVCVWDL